jgi:hypothetical protein
MLTMKKRKKRKKKMTTKTDARTYLVSKGFKPGARGRFSAEMIQALKDSGLEFTRPIKDPKPRSKATTTPLT